MHGKIELDIEIENDISTYNTLLETKGGESCLCKCRNQNICPLE